jgi:phosphotransferase system enzyme I (PtsI)
MSIQINGVAVSRGIAIGEAYVYARERNTIVEYTITKKAQHKEVARFTTALKKAIKSLRELRKKLEKTTPVDILAFIDTHLLMLEDPAFNEGTITNIEAFSCNAEWALQKQGERLMQLFNEIEDPYLRTRQDDVMHVVQRIQDCLADNADHLHDVTQLKGRIIVADDLTPADTLTMQHEKIAGFITEFGGPLSHTAILARNLGIPAIVGVHNARRLILSGEVLIVDGQNGSVINTPDLRSLKIYRKLKRDEVTRKNLLHRLKGKPAITQDKKTIILHGNIDRPEDIKVLHQFDKTGIGLYRTEMLFIDKNEWPDEETQLQYYKRTVQKLQGQPLTIRTIDLGADKEIQDTINHGPMAHNPAMGLRAIRRCLKEPEAFLPQLHAILRASAFGPVRIMIPMLTNIEEVQQVFDLMEIAKQNLRDRDQRFDENMQVGAMIEVPAAALSALAFARKLDFLSIGTNDLIQYTLALDRIDDEVSYLYNPLNPAVLQLIYMTIQAGKKVGVPVSMCGEMASDPSYTRLLLGMGLNYFSVQANALLEIKHIINNSKLSSLRPRVRKILESSDINEIEARVSRLNS